MRWSATLGAWTRREALLTSALAVGASVSASSAPLSAAWLVPAGVFVAAGGAVARLGIATFRGSVEGSRERTEATRRVRAPIATVAETDPTLIGVDPAAQDLLAGDRVPVYLARRVDDDLVAALTAAVEGRGSWLVVVVGASKIGKSRSLFHALKLCEHRHESAAGLRVVAPVDGDALRALLLPGQGPRLGSRVGRRKRWLPMVRLSIATRMTLSLLCGS